MTKQLKAILGSLIAIILAIVVGTQGTAQDGTTSQQDVATQAAQVRSTDEAEQEQAASLVEEGQSYTTKDEIAAYLHEFGHLPPNFVRKAKARDSGWVASQGNLDEVLPGMSIGGDRFWNDEGQLPEAAGRTWTECDVNYHGGKRGAERIVFSSDGLIFYTEDHYKTFEQLY